jgi:FkbM family methyltransferase
MQPNRTAMETHCRSLAKPVRLGKRRLLGRSLGKYPFYCDPDDTSLTPNLVLDGYWEMWVSVALARLIQPGWHVADVGANVGYYTVLFADLVGELGSVLAVEPGNRPRRFLKFNVHMNGFEARTRICPVAVGADDAQAMLWWRSDNTGCASVDKFPSPHRRQQCVEVRRLDDLIAGNPLDLLKVDAEGMDYAVLRGARETLVRNPRCIVVYEHCAALFHSSYGSAENCLNEVLGWGFGLYHIDYHGEIKLVTKEVVLNDANRVWNLVLQR